MSSAGVAAGGSEPRLRRDAERNRRRILAAAHELFAAHGLDVGVEQIAARAGVGMGTLYRRFANKDALIDAIFEARVADYVRIAGQALEREDAWEGLSAFLEAALGLQAADRGLTEILASRRRESRGVGRLIDQLVARAQEQRRLRPDVTAADIVMIMWGAGGVADMTARLAPNVWRRYLGLVLDALQTPAPSVLAEPPLTRAQLRAALSGPSS